MKIQWTSLENCWKISENQRTFMKNYRKMNDCLWIVTQNQLLSGEWGNTRWLTFKLSDVQDHSNSMFEWWASKLAAYLMDYWMMHVWEINRIQWNGMDTQWKFQQFDDPTVKDTWMWVQVNSNSGFQICTNTQIEFLSGERAVWMSNWLIW